MPANISGYTVIWIQFVQVNAALSRVDNTMKSLFEGLKERGVEDCVNIIIVSDHGMTAYDSSKLVTLNSVSSLTTASTAGTGVARACHMTLYCCCSRSGRVRVRIGFYCFFFLLLAYT